jgi:hypothetical protein
VLPECLKQFQNCVVILELDETVKNKIDLWKMSKCKADGVTQTMKEIVLPIQERVWLRLLHLERPAPNKRLCCWIPAQPAGE